jgi:phosphatidylserine decarboxylase
MAETLQEWFDSPTFKELEALSDEKLMRYYFFRDEQRASVIDYDFMMSPADGVILFQKEMKSKDDSIINIKGCDYTLADAIDNRIELQYPCMVCSIFMTAFDVHLNRMPTSGILNHYELDTIASYNRPMLPAENDLMKKLKKTDNLDFLFTNERVLNDVYVPWMNYRYYFEQIADYDVRMIVPFEDKQTRSMLQSERMGMIRWGSMCLLIVPHSDRWDFEFMQEEMMHVRAGSDPLIRIKKLSQTKKFYVLPEVTGLPRNVRDNLSRSKRITKEEWDAIPKTVVEEKKITVDGKEETLKITEVEGYYIRKNGLIENFTMGGHYFVYPGVCPYDTIMIEKSMDMRDKEETVIHELDERLSMYKGMGYDEAHDKALKASKKILHDNPVTVSDDNIEIPPEYAYLFNYEEKKETPAEPNPVEKKKHVRQPPNKEKLMKYLFDKKT